MPTIDAILGVHAEVLGSDLHGYRNHAYRLANFCVAQLDGSTAPVEKIAVAAAFHDLGIWTAGTFDYLGPSEVLAAGYLQESGRPEWIDEVVAMIEEHHKLSRYRGRPEWLVEPFRRADWIDVSMGALTFGLPRDLIRRVQSAWPSAGFHRRLIQLELRRLRTHPWSPLPMVRF